nr:MAG TPA: hypothetical protein [Caudoviricetes sp.]
MKRYLVNKQQCNVKVTPRDNPLGVKLFVE